MAAPFIQNEPWNRWPLPAGRNLPARTPEEAVEPDLAALDAIILSDLHLGSENSQTRLLAQLLSEVLHGSLRTSRLVLNGDVFDSFDFRRLRKTHWKVLSLIRKLSDKIDVVWMAGNHDGSAGIISHLLGVRVLEECVLLSGERRIFLFHGHQHDRFIQDHPAVTWLADVVYAFLQKLDRRYVIARLAKRTSKVFLRCQAKIRVGARASAARHGCDAVICGHTHTASVDLSEGVHYYNCGCWTERPCHYIAIRNGRIELREYDAVPAEEAERPEDTLIVMKGTELTTLLPAISMDPDGACRPVL